MVKTWMVEYYLWFKVFHIIAIVAWMAGLLYLPRLFVYHKGVCSTSEAASLFIIMEYRLYKIIILPAMLFSLASGIILAMISDMWSFGWLHLKVTCVFGLVIFQHLLNYWRKQLIQGTCTRTPAFFRMINELPFVLLVFIVICVIIKPF